MLIHQPVSPDAADEITYFSPDVSSGLQFSKKVMKRLGMKPPMAGIAARPTGGYNSGGTQALIFQVPVRPFEEPAV